MEAAVKPGTGSARPYGVMVSPAGYREQRLWKTQNSELGWDSFWLNMP